MGHKGEQTCIHTGKEVTEGDRKEGERDRNREGGKERGQRERRAAKKTPSCSQKGALGHTGEQTCIHTGTESQKQKGTETEGDRKEGERDRDREGGKERGRDREAGKERGEREERKAANNNTLR